MWIPNSTKPKDPDVCLAVITSAAALGAAVGLINLLRELYLELAKAYGNKIPGSIKVSTHHFEGEGFQLTPVQAYHANELNLLGKEEHRSESGWGATNYTRHFSWRKLNVVKLYELLSDESLPAPKYYRKPNKLT
ncbi:hypothetical protein A2382_03655 [Candidatus Woesebacteria bacterium RIFOXYB1_FULL_38_16]|uniref:Uncharacterized protein n=1 Tax=Candidatus Woesebacteria bacterium RIFOXYB1_FULL_38_16 TaxID=1802538 RepID=A0A1F8CRU7_9BACT|nr:MAG: hypothetical protein A2191_02045 [Candidatus Woesebacteria bacterium RIFOXYA1_FULL_38_9]OGM78981.1 MAG: hypothetical protein A2382_03655 [Candidatus Woesebacteria bacterium RIFOXYB1_FULL_38_16]